MERKTSEPVAWPELMAVADLAARSRLSEGFWYQAIAQGRCPHYRLGRGQGGIRVSEEQYQEFLRACERRQPDAVKPPELTIRPREKLRHLSLDD